MYTKHCASTLARKNEEARLAASSISASVMGFVSPVADAIIANGLSLCLRLRTTLGHRFSVVRSISFVRDEVFTDEMNNIKLLRDNQ